jgi:hypothetical protein
MGSPVRGRAVPEVRFICPGLERTATVL